MTTHPHHEDDERGDDEADDSDVAPEGPDPSEMDSSDDPDLEVCPHCRKLISEEAGRCPHCGEYVNAGDAPISRTWWVVIVLILIATMTGLLWIF